MSLKITYFVDGKHIAIVAHKAPQFALCATLLKNVGTSVCTRLEKNKILEARMGIYSLLKPPFVL
jgi:hypothetical protein